MRTLLLIALILFSTLAFGQELITDEPAVSFMGILMQWVDLLSQLTFAVVILATLLVRIIPGDKDDQAVSKAKASVLKVLHYLPTFGINPRTKALEEALKDIEKK